MVPLAEGYASARSRLTIIARSLRSFPQDKYWRRHLVAVRVQQRRGPALACIANRRICENIDGGGGAEGSGFENHRARKGSASSNLAPSATVPGVVQRPTPTLSLRRAAHFRRPYVRLVVGGYPVRGSNGC